MAGTWADAVKAAMKILGPGGKIPAFPSNIVKTTNDLGKSWNDFVAAQKTLQSAYSEHLRNWDKYQGARLAFIDDLGGGNLGLDPKKKDDAKKISEAKKPLLTYLHNADDRHKANLAKFQNLGSHVKAVVNFVETS